MGNEIEIRIKIDDYEELKKKIESLGGVMKEKYHFVDHLFMPKGVHWDLNKESMKIRVIDDGSAKFGYHLVEWKDFFKIEKFSFKKDFASSDDAFSLLQRWNFEEKFSYNKDGELFSIDGSEFVVEKISNIGYYMEIEGTEEEIKALINKLGLKDIGRDSVPKLVEKAVSSE